MTDSGDRSAPLRVAANWLDFLNPEPCELS